MNDLPEGWTSTTLAEVGRWGSGGTPKASEPSYYGGSIPWIRSGDLQDGPIVKHIMTITNHGLENSPAKWVSNGVILIAMYGATIGKLGITTYPVTTNQAVAFIKPHASIGVEYLFHNLRARKAEFVALGQGGAQPNISQEILKSQIFTLPPLPEQRRIVAKIDSLTGKSRRARDHLDHIPRLVEKYKQAILAAAFRGDLTREWRQNNGQIAPSLHQYVAVDKCRINIRKARQRKSAAITPSQALPSKWCWLSTDQIADDSLYSIGIGPFGSNLVRSDYRETGIRLVFVRDIRRQNFESSNAHHVTLEKAESLAPHSVLPGDVLITKMGDPPGDTALYPQDASPAIITSDCIKIRPHAKLSIPAYIMYCIRADLVKSQLHEITKGVAQQKVNLDGFRQIALPIPPLEEQEEIVRRVETAFAWIDRLAAEATSARKLIDHLDQAVLAKAFRGELVPQDPNDEPASVLLDRIRAERETAPRAKRGRKKTA
ncbi:restriction endonuclease subunit S [Asaia sp. As-1742]|uniref:restriction endonuclease subunit S n=1 Tax=Asaia sp. As-1742 TaxID=2608325 RepID=UPI001422B993|nr:restriction endonuclease subunit S [Asaia sp. As-1742]NIE79652.1 restriction endonuclease [Asaia sp. As-1742]